MYMGGGAVLCAGAVCRGVMMCVGGDVRGMWCVVQGRFGLL